MDKPFSQACENNKQAILTILSDALAQTKLVVEIGSGTGQHAAFFREKPATFNMANQRLSNQSSRY
jgi:16S rRNA A1518/A1519 N6-dimethyltransferase RsmA/KsgA/DIM1 with predicted DNA glycosylase/AP lyase activity